MFQSGWKPRLGSAWRDVTDTLNPVSIGIEIANLGDAVGGSPGHWSAYGRPVPDDRVIVARHANGGPPRPWHTYPPAQVAAVVDLARALDAVFHFEDIVGHDQIAPTRKVDPGPAWDMVAFKRAVMGDRAPPSAAPPIPDSDVPDHSVMQLQRALNRLGCGPIDVDGDAGPITASAVREFQAGHGLKVDGRAGPATWAAIERAMKGGV